MSWPGFEMSVVRPICLNSGSAVGSAFWRACGNVRRWSLPGVSGSMRVYIETVAMLYML